MIKITPANKVVGSMKQAEVEATPVLLALSSGTSSDGSEKLLIEVIFQSVRIRRPLLKGYWYCGSTGADIELRAVDGSIIDHTKSSTLPVKYRIKKEEDKEVNVTIKPGVTFGEEVKFEIGEIGGKSGGSREQEAEYVSHENPLAAVDRGMDAVIWEQSLGRGEKVFRDYLFCNLSLSADCKWTDKKKGEVKLSPSALFFDGQKRRLAGWKALLMEFTLFKRGYTIENRDGIEVQFVL